MKSNILTLLAIATLPLSATAAPDFAGFRIEIIGEPAEPPAKEDLPERVSTKFHNSEIKDLTEAATKLKEQIQEKPFQAIPDPRTSRIILMGSERAINQAIEMLNKMEPKPHDGMLLTKFHNSSIKDLGEAATKLQEQIQEKPFQAIADPRTSRIMLMGSERAINQALELLNQMERE